MKTQEPAVRGVRWTCIPDRRDYLRTPSVILMLIGVLGMVQLYTQEPPTLLSMFRFPSLWGSAALVIGGMALLVMSRVVTLLRRRRVDALPSRRSWRSF